jgi:hypothetical protein
LRVRVDELGSAGSAMLIGPVSGTAASSSAEQVASALMSLGRRYSGEFAGRRTETGAAPFPAAGT